MEMTLRLWRDCHPVMHWEPSLAFCGSHTDETVTPRCVGSRTLEGQRAGAWASVGWAIPSPWASSSQAPAVPKGPVSPSEDCDPRRNTRV